MVWNRTSSVIGLDPRIHVPTTRFGFVGIDHDTWPAKANPRREGDRAVAVGTILSDRPPHRSQRAELPHWALTSGNNAQSLFGIRVYNSQCRKPSCR